ncbi:inorganic pyrophosphatase [Candidatus Woesebacteria bacterium RIFCSPHIGHO2_01_FULL_41_10]|uniref:Inorganic pyrophosphatase n=1 Tax=Candidatus Woesebacteria bacterium RIFCSPHIGHO2_01_FULL_41_10 TaxID=1802500 RepID=A0A1F7YQR0_9BACT|nr:MAG: inorganic pyrophosphatase [Candidatus Woesebacteria bacterium RIFCSPHIGHO2_01_FULL_41_10]
MADANVFKAFIEIPSGGNVKYEVDEETGELTVDRFLHTAYYYPFNYGYIKDTKGEDGDPVDVVILSSEKVVPGVVMKVQVIGMLDMEDEAGVDTKILAVPVKKVDPVYGEYEDIKDVPQAILNKIKQFFEHYKDLEPGKWVKVRDFSPKEKALKVITKAQS